MTPRKRTRGPYGYRLRRRPAVWLDRRCRRGLPVLVHEVSRRAWGLRLRRTDTGTRADDPAHVAFRALQRRRRPDLQFSELDNPPRLSPCLRFGEHLAMSAAKLGAEWFAGPFS